jgi:hypothetical protein
MSAPLPPKPLVPPTPPGAEAPPKRVVVFSVSFSPWERLLRAWQRYADWLAEQSGKRLAVLALLALIVTSILSNLPPFSTRWGRTTTTVLQLPRGAVGDRSTEGDVEVHIGGDGVRVKRKQANASAATDEAPATSDAAASKGDAVDAPVAASSAPVPPVPPAPQAKTVVVREGFSLGEHMMSLTLLLIFGSLIVRVMGVGRRRAEVQAAEATERAEHEQLQRQLMQARLAAMQAQVEPHFLFNTLATIDHLIETDPARASRMQKQLIALLRARLPHLRDGAVAAVSNLGSEMDMVLPYLEILKMRMEERLQVQIDVPEGLRSAEFPPLMLQSLVENAIAHGLEPKDVGGSLHIAAQVSDGRLCVTVADTGLGFGEGATAGTGLGLANIRERLHMLYGDRAELRIERNQPAGTRVQLCVPYTHRASASGASA